MQNAIYAQSNIDLAERLLFSLIMSSNLFKASDDDADDAALAEKLKRMEQEVHHKELQAEEKRRRQSAGAELVASSVEARNEHGASGSGKKDEQSEGQADLRVEHEKQKDAASNQQHNEIHNDQSEAYRRKELYILEREESLRRKESNLAEIEHLHKLAEETRQSQERLRVQEELEREEEQCKQHMLREKAVEARMAEIRQKEVALEEEQRQQDKLKQLALDEKLKEISRKEHELTLKEEALRKAGASYRKLLADQEANGSQKREDQPQCSGHGQAYEPEAGGKANEKRPPMDQACDGLDEQEANNCKPKLGKEDLGQKGVAQTSTPSEAGQGDVVKSLEQNRAELKERQMAMRRRMADLDREIAAGGEAKRLRTDDAGGEAKRLRTDNAGDASDAGNKHMIVETGSEDPTAQQVSDRTRGFQGANSVSHYDEWRRFGTKCRAKCRADSHMSKAFLQGGRAAHEAFETFLQACF